MTPSSNLVVAVNTCHCYDYMFVYICCLGNWIEDLMKVIRADQLPVQWGSTMVDPVTGNHYCSSLVSYRLCFHIGIKDIFQCFMMSLDSSLSVATLNMFSISGG